MEINVTAHTMTLVGKHSPNEGEYNVSTCDFNFSEDYTDDLVKVGVFTRDGLTYKNFIINNTCAIPIEILEKTGNMTIGVYAYTVADDVLTIRFSPKPITLKIDLGSFIGNAQNASHPTPSELEQLTARVATVESGMTQVRTNKQDIANLKINKADVGDIPTLLSELANDVGFITGEGYVTDTSLATTLEDYVSNSSLATTLADYVTNTGLSTTLADYVSNSSLLTTLASYVTGTSLATTLLDYVTNSSLATTLTGYVDTTTFETLSDKIGDIADYVDDINGEEI